MKIILILLAVSFNLSTLAKADTIDHGNLLGNSQKLKPVRFGPYDTLAAKEHCEDAADMIRKMSTENVFFIPECTEIQKQHVFGSECIYEMKTSVVIR